MTPTDNTTVRLVGIGGFGTGILFSDKSSEYFAFTSSIHDGTYDEEVLFVPNTLYTTYEIAAGMEQKKGVQVGGMLPVPGTEG